MSMIEGILVINLDPPYMGFFEKDDAKLAGDLPSRMLWRDCSLYELRDLLIDLEAITAPQAWPPRECILRLPVLLPRAKLVKHGLAGFCDEDRSSFCCDTSSHAH